MVPQALVCRPIPCFSPSLSSQSARLCRPQPTGARHFVRNKDLGHYKLLVHLSSWQRSSNKGIQILGSGGGRIIQGSSGLRFAQACSIWGDSIWVSNSYGEQRKKMPRCASLQVRSVTTPADIETSFDQMIVEMKRKYYMLGGKGGVGKTSCAASLAVKFANSGHPTLIVSTDPAHSLSDSFAQDLSGGNLVAVEGPDSPLFALEINPEQARAEFRASSQNAGGSGVKDFMDSMGLGSLADQTSNGHMQNSNFECIKVHARTCKYVDRHACQMECLNQWAHAELRVGIPEGLNMHMQTSCMRKKYT